MSTTDYVTIMGVDIGRVRKFAGTKIPDQKLLSVLKFEKEEIPDDCNDAKSEIQIGYTANAMYYVDYNEYAPDIDALSSYGYTPTELSTGYVQYGVSGDRQASGWWEGSRRDVACSGESGAGRWTLEQNIGTHVWRNNSELQSWRDSIGI